MSLMCHVPTSAGVMLARCSTSAGDRSSAPLIAEEPGQGVPSGLMKVTEMAGVTPSTLIAAGLAMAGVVDGRAVEGGFPFVVVARQAGSGGSLVEASNASDET